MAAPAAERACGMFSSTAQSCWIRSAEVNVVFASDVSGMLANQLSIMCASVVFVKEVQIRVVIWKHLEKSGVNFKESTI